MKDIALFLTWTQGEYRDGIRGLRLEEHEDGVLRRRVDNRKRFIGVLQISPELGVSGSYIGKTIGPMLEIGGVR